MPGPKVPLGPGKSSGLLVRSFACYLLVADLLDSSSTALLEIDFANVRPLAGEGRIRTRAAVLGIPPMFEGVVRRVNEVLVPTIGPARLAGRLSAGLLLALLVLTSLPLASASAASAPCSSVRWRPSSFSCC